MKVTWKYGSCCERVPTCQMSPVDSSCQCSTTIKPIMWVWHLSVSNSFPVCQSMCCMLEGVVWNLLLLTDGKCWKMKLAEFGHYTACLNNVQAGCHFWYDYLYQYACTKTASHKLISSSLCGYEEHKNTELWTRINKYAQKQSNVSFLNN